jgi:hypothetical protein
MTFTISKTLVVMTLGAAMLTACGGGGSPVQSPAIEYVADSGIPAAAEKDVTEVISFSKAQIATTSDASDPVLLANAMLAVSDTTEPLDI